ncbi:MAG: amidohydrolase [Chloroflexi bacterium]|nr:amidohydrolase [Chloroflexota bacterium]
MADDNQPEMMLDWLDENSPRFTKMADDIWAHPEILWGEFFSSKLQADFLKAEGFKITENPAGMNTAFIAEWGEGKPILGLVGEYDALPGLSQEAESVKKPIEEGAPGHGCGHNLLGVTTLAATVALQKWMQQNNIKATLRYYGCPAEEIGGGKVFFARDGFFDDLDAALSYHPGFYNMASYMTTVAIVSSVFKFTGVSAHAGSSPYLGRSALDAVELMNVGANYMREHVLDGTRIQYVITNGGQAANIVPETAAVHYIIRAETAEYVKEVMDRLRNIARGAAMMTDTTYEETIESGFASMYANRYLADLMYSIMKKLGPIQFTEEEMTFAQRINTAFGKSNAEYLEEKIANLKFSPEHADLIRREANKPLHADNYPPMDGNIIYKGATDVGDLSQVTPTAALWTACFPSCSPGHSWANTATAGMSIGHKGMMHGAKILALTAAEMLLDQTHFDKAREEFNSMMAGKKYQPLLPEGFQPPHREP